LTNLDLLILSEKFNIGMVLLAAYTFRELDNDAAVLPINIKGDNVIMIKCPGFKPNKQIIPKFRLI